MAKKLLCLKCTILYSSVNDKSIMNGNYVVNEYKNLKRQNYNRINFIK